MRAFLIGAFGVGSAVAIAIFFMQARHYQKAHSNVVARLQLEQAAHRQTVANYRAAALEAERRQAETIKRIEGARASAAGEIMDDYEKRLAAARLVAQRLREGQATRANPGGPRHDPVPGPADAASRVDGPAEEAGLSDADRLIATEQALQLDALQRWVREVVGIK